jgi:hypothetical protein
MLQKLRFRAPLAESFIPDAAVTKSSDEPFTLPDR